MVDVALSLEAAGYRGQITALSRRGLIPRGHASFTPAPVDGEALPTGLRAITRWLRRRAAQVGWRAAVDSLRPHSHRLWQGLTLDEQRRFQRHARPWWDVHRHRIAPQVADIVARLVADGQLTVMAGKVDAVRERPNGLELDIRRRGAATRQAISVDYAINCTGPLHAISRTGTRFCAGCCRRVRSGRISSGSDSRQRGQSRRRSFVGARPAHQRAVIGRSLPCLIFATRRRRSPTTYNGSLVNEW